MKADYEAIVIGVGGVGSSTLFHLAQRGIKVLGIDQFSPPHPQGSSHGQTRIIRQAYFEHVDYVPLLLDSYRQWDELQTVTGSRLFQKTGLLEVGPPDGIVVPGVLSAAKEHQLDVTELSPDEIQKRWPAFHPTKGQGGVFEKSGGILFVEDCIQAFLDSAQQAGAKLLTNCKVQNWTVEKGYVLLQTDEGEISSERLIIAAGPWASQVLSELQLPLTILRKSLFWFDTPKDCKHFDADSDCPAFLFETPSGIFYGFPKLDASGVKISEHSGGQPIKDPLSINREVCEQEETTLLHFAKQYMPELLSTRLNHAACMYTMTPDENFILDFHPQHKEVVFCAGLSGHGFKMTPALGKAMTGLTLDGGTDLSVEFLSAKRF